MQIEHKDLAIGQRVWYKYSESRYEAAGPFRVKARYSNYQGEHINLSSSTYGDRDVLLATDDDYGDPIFYDAKPT